MSGLRAISRGWARHNAAWHGHLARDWPLALLASGIGVADGGCEGERGFLRLRGSREGGGEGGEILQAEAAAPDFGAQLMDGALSGDAGGGRSGHPFGARQESVAGAGEGALGGEEKQGVGSDSE